MPGPGGYWLTPPRMASTAASSTSGGPSVSGKPWPRLIAPVPTASADISAKIVVPNPAQLRRQDRAIRPHGGHPGDGTSGSVRPPRRGGAARLAPWPRTSPGRRRAAGVERRAVEREQRRADARRQLVAVDGRAPRRSPWRSSPPGRDRRGRRRCPACSTTNSSPPQRPTRSELAHAPRSAPAAATSTRSPASWPTVSLTSLEPVEVDDHQAGPRRRHGRAGPASRSPGARTRRGWAAPVSASVVARRCSARCSATIPPRARAASAAPTASWAPTNHRSSVVRWTLADVVVRTAHGPSSNSTTDGTAYERSLADRPRPQQRLALHGHQAGSRCRREGPTTSSVVLAWSRRPPWSMATTTSLGRRSSGAATTTIGQPTPMDASTAAPMSAAPTVGGDEQRRAGVVHRAHREGQRAAELTHVGVDRGHREHGADAGERLVELGGRQLGRRHQLAVTLGAELVAPAQQASDARGQQGDPGDQRDHPHEAHAAISARTGCGNSDFSRRSAPVHERRDGSERRAGGVEVGGVADAGQHEPADRPGTPCLDRVELGEACRTGRRRPARASTGTSIAARRSLDVPRPERRRQPHVVPAAERGVGVDVVAGQPLPQVGRPRRRRGRRRCRRPSTSSTNTCGASSTSPATAMAGAGVEQGDRRAVAVADQHRPLDAELRRAAPAARRRPRRACSVTGRGSRGRTAAPVAVPRVDDHRRAAVAAGRRRGTSATGRSSRAPRGGTRAAAPGRRTRPPRLDARRRAAPRPMSKRSPRQGAAASCSRRANRRILPVAVFGSWSTTTTRRGRLKAAIRDRQWASIAVGVDVATGAGHDEGDDGLQPGGVAGADHGRFEHVGVLDEHRLHLGRRDPDAAGLDHVVVAAEERPVPVVAERV